MKFTVTIDGPAAAGKGTLAARLSATFGFSYLDTGLLFRATGARVLAGEDAIHAARNLRISDLERNDLRTAEVGQAASKASAIPEVREALLEFQLDFSRRPGGAILDGRCIAIEVCPDAEVQLFCTASDEVRAARRHAELAAAGGEMSFEEVLADLRARDARDASRSAAPMRPAPAAVILDTSEMSIDEVVAIATGLVREKLPQAA